MKKIVHISDIHFGREDHDVLGHLTDKILEILPDLLVFSGDLTQRARTEQFLKARTFLEQFEMPVIVIPGNHDVPMYNFFNRFINPLKKFNLYITSDMFPFFSDEQLTVLGLNTARSMTIKGGRINEEQIAEIAAKFSGIKKDTLKILVTHHPFDVPEGRDEDDIVQNAESAMRVIDSSGIDILLAGHLHLSSISNSARRYKTDSGREILIIQAGTAASTRVRGEVNSFNLIEFEDQQLAVSRYEFNESASNFQPAEIKRYLKSEKGWKAAREE